MTEKTEKLIQRLSDNQAKIREVLSWCDAQSVRIWVDTNIYWTSLVKARFAKLISHNHYRWYWSIERLSLLLGCVVNLCAEGAVKNFHPETYKETLSTCHWSS